MLLYAKLLGSRRGRKCFRKVGDGEKEKKTLKHQNIYYQNEEWKKLRMDRIVCSWSGRALSLPSNSLSLLPSLRYERGGLSQMENF
jgi:hypothetical protein